MCGLLCWQQACFQVAAIDQCSTSIADVMLFRVKVAVQQLTRLPAATSLIKTLNSLYPLS